MRSTLLLVLLMMVGADAVAAQAVTTLPAGARVRWLEDGDWIEGEVRQSSPRGAPILVVIMGGNRTMSPVRRHGLEEEISWTAEQLQLRTRAADRWRGALIGGAIGVAVGAMIGFADGDDEVGFIQLTAAQKAAMAGIGLGLIGLPVGAIASPGSRWASVGATGDVRVHVGAGALGLRLSF